MTYQRTLRALLLIGLSTWPIVNTWAESTQKPTGWLDLNARIMPSTSHSATLELILQSPLPEADIEVQLNLPDGIHSEASTSWTGHLIPNQPRILNWPLTRPDPTTGSIGITVIRTDAEGNPLDYRAETAWPEPQPLQKSQAQPPDGHTQYRHGEALWVVPLNEAPRR